MGVLIILSMFLLIGIGVVVALITAMVCLILAHIRNANAIYFALWGALFGASITGAAYVLFRLYNRPPPFVAMLLIYVVPYALWILVTVGLIGSIQFIWQYTVGYETSPGRYYVASHANISSAVLMSVLLSGVAVVNIFTWAMSMRSLYGTYRRDRVYPLKGQLIDFAYMKPFVYMYLWLIGGLLSAYVVAKYMISIGVDIQGF